MTGRLWTLAEAADHFSVSVESLRSQRYHGRPPGCLAVKVGRHLRFDPDELVEWWDEERRRQRVADETKRAERIQPVER